MAKGANQKKKLFCILELLERESDELHPVATERIIEYLAANDISAERKSIYDDVQVLQELGYDVISCGRKGYCLGAREFELAELKLLVDAVQSSKFLTEKKSHELIKKLEQFCSRHEAGKLQRQVHVFDRVKTMNESIYYNVDEIHRGIAENKKIRFRYFEYTVGKERAFRRGGEWYVMSPYALTWDDENYYMVAYDSAAGVIKHFRVDKMTEIDTAEESRDGQEIYAAMDMGTYARKTFGMFTGEETSVQLRFEKDLVGPVLDRLGRDVMLIPDGNDHFTLRTDVVVSPQFYAWIFGFGSKAEILAPDHVAEGMREQLKQVLKSYEK